MPRAAQRALDIFETFARVRRPMSVSEVAREVGVPLSTCHGLIKALEARGFLVDIKPKGGYYPTRRLEHLGRDIGGYGALPAWLLPRLEKFRDECMETVLLARRTGNAAMYIEMVESQQSLRYIVKVGDIRPLHGTAVGLALLAAMPQGDREIMLSKLRLERRTKATITTRAALRAAIDKGLARGWFMTQGDYFEEISAMAKAICIEGEAYAVAVAGPVERMGRKRRQHAEALLAMHRWALDIQDRPARRP